MNKQLTEYQRYLIHRALWIWCGETGDLKYRWPGWKLEIISEDYAWQPLCFLCVVGRDCNEARTINCRSFYNSHSCLDGLFGKYENLKKRLVKYNSWINKRAYELICYKIALLEWVEKPSPKVIEYMEVRKMLQEVYGDYEVHFVPVDKKDYKRFLPAIKKNLPDNVKDQILFDWE